MQNERNFLIFFHGNGSFCVKIYSYERKREVPNLSGLKEERNEAINEKNAERIVPDWEQTNEEKELVAQELSEGLSNLILEFQGRKKAEAEELEQVIEQEPKIEEELTEPEVVMEEDVKDVENEWEESSKTGSQYWTREELLEQPKEHGKKPIAIVMGILILLLVVVISGMAVKAFRNHKGQEPTTEAVKEASTEATTEAKKKKKEKKTEATSEATTEEVTTEAVTQAEQSNPSSRQEYQRDDSDEPEREPATEASTTEAATTETVTTEAPATEAPATEAPATEESEETQE